MFSFVFQHLGFPPLCETSDSNASGAGGAPRSRDRAGAHATDQDLDRQPRTFILGRDPDPTAA
ncbi:hypothetical protein EYF80_065785 [Liparis tanakae]|uniref:Uncharacterized protein n=1 Tax=Liparis tanakae TaxID=230148 RepID=A0A4Z2E6Y0_9TELE|nr:hypothetical protein EYF80_065785 [Liparis tanakae]